MASTASSVKFDYTRARKAGFTDEDIAKSLAAKRAQGVKAFVDPAEVQAYRNAFTQGPAPYPGQANPAVETAKKGGQLPATWLMREVGARVDAGEASAVRAFTGQGPFLKGLFVDAPYGYVTGNPPAGLPREQAAYGAFRGAGLGPTGAAIASIAGSIPAAGPLNLVGGELAGPILEGMSAAGKALIRTNPVTRSMARFVSRTGEMTPKDAAATERMFEGARGEQRMLQFQGEQLAKRFDKAGDRAIAVRDAAENFSRWGPSALEGLSPEERTLALDARQWLDAHPVERPGFGLQSNDLGTHIRGFAQDVQRSQLGLQQAQRTAEAAKQMEVANPFGGRGYRVANPVAKSGNAQPFINPETPSIKAPAPVPGTATEAATLGLSKAQRKDYARLLSERRAAATQARMKLGEKMQMGNLPPSQAKDIAKNIDQILPGYFPRGRNEEAALAAGEVYRPSRAPGGINVTSGASRKLSPEMTTAEGNAAMGGNFFETPGQSLRMYAGKEGVKRRNAIVLKSLAQGGQPTASAPKGWVPLDKIASQAGLDEPTQAALSSVSVKPEFARYANDFVRGAMPQNEAAALAFSRKMGSTIKPLLTVVNPGFLQKFMGWHALKLTLDGEANPGALALAVKAMRGKNLAAPVSLKGAPQIRTLGDLRNAMIRAGAYGGGHGAGQELFPGVAGVAKVNTAVYDATKSTYFISRLGKGDDLTTAAIKAKRALLDYSPENFTNVENFTRQHLAYFYAFPRQIVPAFVRTLIGRPGSMGAMQQVSANAGARIGVTPNQIQNDMGPAISEQGGIPTSRSATNPDSVNVLRTTVNPFSHINQLFGTRGRPGIQGPVDAMSSMVSNPVLKAAGFLTNPNYDSFLGKTLDPSKPAKAPAAARWIIQVAPGLAQKMRLSLVNGQPYAPESTVRWLYMTPQIFNAAADAMNSKDPDSRKRARKFLGMVEDQVDMQMQRSISEGRKSRAEGDSLKYEGRLQAVGR